MNKRLKRLLTLLMLCIVNKLMYIHSTLLIGHYESQKFAIAINFLLEKGPLIVEVIFLALYIKPTHSCPKNTCIFFLDNLHIVFPKVHGVICIKSQVITFQQLRALF